MQHYLTLIRRNKFSDELTLTFHYDYNGWDEIFNEGIELYAGTLSDLALWCDKEESEADAFSDPYAMLEAWGMIDKLTIMVEKELKEKDDADKEERMIFNYFDRP